MGDLPDPTSFTLWADEMQRSSEAMAQAGEREIAEGTMIVSRLLRQGAAAQRLLQSFADSAVRTGGKSWAPDGIWRDLMAFLDDPGRFTEATRDEG